MTETDRLLTEYARLMNVHGADAPESNAYVFANSDNQEFVELASASNWPKKALDADGLPVYEQTASSRCIFDDEFARDEDSESTTADIVARGFTVCEFAVFVFGVIVVAVLILTGAPK